MACGVNRLLVVTRARVVSNAMIDFKSAAARWLKTGLSSDQPPGPGTMSWVIGA